ncbi:MAG: hypothetical protein SPF91_11070 [Clostridium sp.]|nr:hypothetical protein [Clostridium sp.]
MSRRYLLEEDESGREKEAGEARRKQHTGLLYSMGCFLRASPASFSLFPESCPEDIITMLCRAFPAALIRLIPCAGKNKRARPLR